MQLLKGLGLTVSIIKSSFHVNYFQSYKYIEFFKKSNDWLRKNGAQNCVNYKDSSPANRVCFFIYFQQNRHDQNVKRS